jgi:Protein of unknown function (DUF2892)
MTKNIGQTEKIVRIVLAVVLAGLDYFEVVKGAFSWVLSLIAIILLVTAFIGFCPINKMMGRNAIGS